MGSRKDVNELMQAMIGTLVGVINIIPMIGAYIGGAIGMFMVFTVSPIMSLGFTISIVLMAGLREKMEYNDVPKYFQGFPIVLLTAGLMAIAFFGFSGVI